MYSKNELNNKESCEERLKFLNYLRKGQCTMTLDRRRRTHPTNSPSQNSECEITLAEMRKVASDCMSNIGYK